MLCSFSEKCCFYVVSQELLLDICTVVLSQLSAKALFYFFKFSKKILNQTHADRQICFIFSGKTQWKQRSPGWPGFGEGTEAEGAEAPSQADLTMLLQRLIMNPLRTPSYLEKSRTVRNMCMLQLSHKLAIVTPAHNFCFFGACFSLTDSETRDHYHL